MLRSGLSMAASAALVLAAGAALAGPRPQAVELSESGLVVVLSNAVRCEAVRPGAALEWSGRLQGCGMDWDYAVRMDPGSNPVRDLVRAVFSPTGVWMAAVGEVALSDPSGRTRAVFVSPPATAED